ncbi:hypothetical protein AVEN_265615-1 [Araneus ventricosus]|uniref:Uncharacterized protein n=1 Tax=Araneus ventricosus TaxID=182803 RepID=A0A4Y2VZF0_ARAVE|nr:hypothetical protein AVEN_265615-1 [Araneus ventricosus]
MKPKILFVQKGHGTAIGNFDFCTEILLSINARRKREELIFFKVAEMTETRWKARAAEMTETRWKTGAAEMTETRWKAGAAEMTEIRRKVLSCQADRNKMESPEPPR